jgi:hypothetical protein
MGAMASVKKSGAQVDIPVRRYGMVPPPPEEDLCYEVEPQAPEVGTIAERGAIAVWLGALTAACIAAFLLYS